MHTMNENHVAFLLRMWERHGWPPDAVAVEAMKLAMVRDGEGGTDE